MGIAKENSSEGQMPPPSAAAKLGYGRLLSEDPLDAIALSSSQDSEGSQARPLPQSPQMENKHQPSIDSLTLETRFPLLGVKVGFAIKDSVERLSKVAPGDVQGIAASQIQLLSSYYSLVFEQARQSFRWALIAAGLGLAFFLASLGLLIARQPQNLAVVSLISGALIEVISGINFYLYNKASSQLADFHHRLDLTQRILLANSICERLEGDFKQQARLNLVNAIAGATAVSVTDKDKSGQDI